MFSLLTGYLIEEDAVLQQTAAMADHLIPTLASYFRKNDLSDDEYAKMREVMDYYWIVLTASEKITW